MKVSVKQAIGIAATVGAVGLGGGGLYYSPYGTIAAMRQAAIDRNSKALSENLDFNSLQSSIKGSIKAKVVKQLADRTKAGNPTKIEPQTIDKLVDPLVDKIVTPEGIDLLLNEKLPEAKFKLSEVEKNIDRSRVQMSYESFDRFVVKVAENTQPQKDVRLIFKRDGLSWKLSEIDLSQV
jgi:hypothetical protein